MSKAEVTISDISNTLVPDGQAVTVIVRSHPTIEHQVQIDAGVTEVQSLLDNAGEYVVLDIIQDGETTQVVVELSEFNALFKDDAYTVLAAAQPVKTAKTTSATKRDPSKLQEIRDWCRANGWPNIKDKGRIVSEAQAAYDAAHPAELWHTNLSSW